MRARVCFTMVIVMMVVATSMAPSASYAARDDPASLTIRLLDCPERTDPAVNPDRCTDRVNDKGTGYISSEELSFAERLSNAPRKSTGQYRFPELEAGDYRIVDVRMNEARAQWIDGAFNDGAFTLSGGQEYEITVYFYLPTTGPELADVRAGRLFVRLISCPQRVDPRQQQEDCTRVLADDGRARVSSNGERGIPLVRMPRTPEGVYIASCEAGEPCVITGMQPSNSRSLWVDGDYTYNDPEGAWTFTLRRLENQYVTFYYYGRARYSSSLREAAKRPVTTSSSEL